MTSHHQRKNVNCLFHEFKHAYILIRSELMDLDIVRTTRRGNSKRCGEAQSKTAVREQTAYKRNDVDDVDGDYINANLYSVKLKKKIDFTHSV